MYGCVLSFLVHLNLTPIEQSLMWSDVEVDAAPASDRQGRIWEFTLGEIKLDSEGVAIVDVVRGDVVDVEDFGEK